MTKRIRRIIFYIFVAIFLVLTPCIILYALGYAVDFKNKAIVETGGIYLKSIPSGAEIYVNYNPEGKTNKFVKRIMPKIYDVEIAKEGYNHWQKKLTVDPGRVTKVSDILLIPSNPKISLMATTSEEYALFENKKDNLYFTANNILYSSRTSKILARNVINYVIYKNGIIYLDNVTGKIFELDLTTLKSTQMFDQVFPSLNQGKWILSDNNKKLLCQKDKSVEILWLDNVNDNSILRKKGDIEKIDFEQKINDVIWYPKTDEHLIVATDNSIIVTELDNRPPRNTINFIATENPQIKYDAGKKILYFLSQNKLYQTEL